MSEFDETDDPTAALNSGEIGSRVTVEVSASNVCSDDFTPCVVDGDCDTGTCLTSPTVIDTETGASLTGAFDDSTNPRFVLDNVVITDQTLPDPGNGVLDVRDDATIVVSYADESNGVPSADLLRTSTAIIECTSTIVTGDVVFGQFGTDTLFDIQGGCERNARNQFETGFPDLFMDAGETISYAFGFESGEPDDLENILASARCVIADADSPEDCRPGTNGVCGDPERLNNPPCFNEGGPFLSILNNQQIIDRLPQGAAISVNFTVAVAQSLDNASDPQPEIEMVLELQAPTAGNTALARAVNRHTLNVDETSVFYSTDFPTGGSEIYDLNNNDIVENPITTPDFVTDYVFEGRTWGDLTMNGANAALVGLVPWNFDVNDGGFTSGITSASDNESIADVIAQWGEDQDFNNVISGNCIDDPSIQCNRFPGDPSNCPVGPNNFGCSQVEDRDPTNAPIPLLDQNWSTAGGCGYQTKAPGTCSLDSDRGCYDDADCAADATATPPLGDGGVCSGPGQAAGGVWHTGTISDRANSDLNPADCTFAGPNPGTGDCQTFETISGETGNRVWAEVLRTPVMEKVSSDPDVRVEIQYWEWNQAIDLPDNNVAFAWEFDTDTAALEPTDLVQDNAFLNIGFGGYGAVANTNNPDLTDGFSVFGFVPQGQLPGGTPNPAVVTENGTVGPNRDGRNSCFFEFGNIPDSVLRSDLGIAEPADDDVNNGFCVTGNDQNTSCSLVCQGSTNQRCNTTADCSAASAGFCSGDTARGCSVTEDCIDRAGTCADSGTCDTEAGSCTGDSNIACTVDSDCNTVFSCSGDRSISCSVDDDCITNDSGTCGNFNCIDGDPVCGGVTCQLGSTSPADIDRYVTPAGPVRNMNIFAFNGPDMRFNTLEDLFGDTGDTFQAAVAIVNVESDSATAPVGGFGFAVDDMVVQWREVTEGLDQTDCANGECATLDVQAGSTFGGNTILDVTLIESSPYATRCQGGDNANAICFNDGECTGGGTCVQTFNDCDGDGDFFGNDDDSDCDNDTIDDLRIECFTETESNPGEFIVLNRERANIFTGELPTSVTFDVDGVLFGAQQGNDLPTVTCRYFDGDDGTGSSVCANSVVPEAQGLVQVATAIIVDTGSLVVTRFTIDDNGDGDGYADEQETVQLRIELSNTTQEPLTNVAARVASLGGDPDIDCILDTFVFVGDIGPESSVFVDNDFFELRIADTVRGNGDGDTLGELALTVDSDQFASSASPTVIQLDLDVDASGGGTPSVFSESFEVGDLGGFTTMALDAGRGNFGDPDFGEAFALSDGFRCQYHDPEWVASVSFGVIQDCFLNPTNLADEYFWQTTAQHAHTGLRSLYWGIELGNENFTTPFSKLQAVETQAPINLGYDRVCSVTRLQTCNVDGDCPGGESCVFANPRLQFLHQVSLMNNRAVNSGVGESADVGVVQVQPVANDGTEGDWQRVESVVNPYDEQHTNNFFNCTFDPIDDGNTEDDFFDPTDPNRNQGPSSTCIPAVSWVNMGSTAGDFDEFALGNAVGGAEAGSVGDGTWINADIDLQLFRGRRVNLRFVESGLKAGGLRTWEQAFQFNPDPADDGWFIDSITVVDTITSPATIGEDLDVVSLPGCGLACNTVTADLVADPATLGAPGQVVELTAVDSVADRCLDGVLQYRFWADGDGDNQGGGGLDTLLRDFTADPTFVDAPASQTNYVVDVRCATAPDCVGTIAQSVPVDCPATANFDPLGGFLLADQNDNFFWPLSVTTAPQAQGLLSVLDSNYVTTAVNSVSGTSFSAAADSPSSGDGFWYLVEGEGSFCNQFSWETGGDGEGITFGSDLVNPIIITLPGRDAALP